jgi:hypothetical protein
MRWGLGESPTTTSFRIKFSNTEQPDDHLLEGPLRRTEHDAENPLHCGYKPSIRTAVVMRILVLEKFLRFFFKKNLKEKSPNLAHPTRSGFLFFRAMWEPEMISTSAML